MANLTLLDRLQLVKAGYKAKQIEEMIIKDAADVSESEVPAENTSKGEAEPEQAKEQKVESVPEKEAEPDYKKLFEDMQRSNEDLQKKLEAAQSLNREADASVNATPKKDAQSVVNDIFKDIL